MRHAIMLFAALAVGAAIMSGGYSQTRNTTGAVTQKWEYKVLSRGRNAEYKDLIRSGFNVSDWTYNEDGKEIGKLDLVAKLRELGNDGWELVSAIPLSGGTGGDFAGFTSHVIFTFKRPK